MNSAINVQDLMDQSPQEIEHHQAKSAIVGKDILELISVSMYVDPLTMYREYIQNATDAIDLAVEEGTLQNTDEGKISIQLSVKDRSVIIRDNGSGIKSQTFESIMLSFGNSQKRGGKARGFRGVGRFAGLAYCQNLIFRTHAENEKVISEIKWNGRKFKQILSDNESPKNLEELVAEVATITTYKAKRDEKPFFEIQLEKVVRAKNDLLLSSEQVFNYVAQNCPVPYSPDFSFKNHLEDFLVEHNIQPGYDILLSDGFVQDRKILRPNRNKFFISETESDEITGIEKFYMESVHEGISAIGWIFNHNYKGVIPLSENIRGIRIRVGNMQIGDERILCNTFPEVRFNSWSIGEVHILDEKIIPNGRRDNFEQNVHWLELQNKFTTFAKEIARTCRKYSSERNAIKIFYSEFEKFSHLVSVFEQGVLTKAKLESYKKDIELSLLKLEKFAGAATISPDKSIKLLEDLENIRGKIKFLDGMDTTNNDFFERIPKLKRKTVKEIFDLIYECSPNRVVAKSLIDKIVERYLVEQNN